MKIKVSLFDNRFERVPSMVTIDSEIALDHILNFGHKARKKLPKDKERLWSPAAYEPNATRKSANVIELSMMVFDVDDGTTFNHHYLFCDYRYYAHTTHSHTEDHHKWRLVLPFKKPIKRENWRRAWQAGKNLFQHRTGSDIDGACKDPARMYYIAPPFGEHLFFDGSQEGNFLKLNWESIPEEKPKNKIVTLTNRRAMTAKSSEYKIMMALKMEPESRQKAAEQLKANISDDGIARGIVCPSCGRPDVWFAINPAQKHVATCNHQNSCRWFGSVYDLLTEGAI